MTKELIFLSIMLAWIFMYCITTTPSDSEMMLLCGDNEGCKYAVVPH